MTRSTVRRGLALLLVGVSISLAGPDERVTLRRQFAPGQTNFYILEHDETTRQSFSLMPIPIMEQRRCTDALMEHVLRVRADGSAEVEWKLDRVQYQKSGQHGDVRWDSAGGMNPVPEAMAASMLLGQTLRTVQKPFGELEAVASAPATASASSRAAATQGVGYGGATGGPRGPSPLVRPAAGRGPGGFYDADSYQRMLARVASEFLPPGPVAVGQTWRMRVEEVKPSLGTLVHQLRYTLKAAGGAVGARTAVIGVEGECTIEPPAPTPGPSKVKTKLTLKKGAWTGEIQFDLEKGRVRAATLRHENDIEAEMTGGDANMTFNLGQAEERTVRFRSVPQLPAKPIKVQATRPVTSAAGAARVSPTTRPALRLNPAGVPATQRGVNRARPGADKR